MHAFHFGDSKQPLVGVYHAPVQRNSRMPAVLLCNPFGEEAVRAFRMLRILADQLSEAGAPVLRFDYYGTGDSSGACEEVRAERCTGSILLAHQELQDMAGTQKIVWIGLRLGAAFAARAAARASPAPAGVIFWDPVADGATYLAAITDQVMGTSNDRKTAETLGFVLPDPLRTELQDLTPETCVPKRLRQVVAVCARDEEGDPALAAALARSTKRLTWHADPEVGSWNSDDMMNAFHIPTRTLSTITDEVKAWR